jgi:site-specific recombinase XerD
MEVKAKLELVYARKPIQKPIEKTILLPTLKAIPQKRVGRPRVLDQETLLKAIEKYATKSPTKLARYLNISRRTVWRVMKRTPEERINVIFRELAETELKPFQMEWDVWLQIPEVQEYNLMLDKREVAKDTKNKYLRTLWYASTYLKRHPAHFDIDECATLLTILRKTKVHGLSYDMTRMAIRNWFITKGVSGELLTAKGISGELCENFGKRAHDRLTKEQRRRFIEALHEIVNSMSDYVLSLTWDLLPYWLYYTGTRIAASLQVRIENITPKEIDSMKTANKLRVKVIDKGRHKRGRTKWWKLCVGELKEKIIRLLEARGNPQQGLLFEGLSYQKVRQVFREAYRKAGIEVAQPCHIWRHTGAQDLLDATDWNYEVVASILGWKDTRTLKQCYGAMGETVKERALRKAMGEPIEEIKKEFKF